MQNVDRINLSAKSIPFVSNFWGESVINPQHDMNFDRTVVSQKDSDKDRGIPQAYYMHNVMPTSQGFQAIAYDDVIAGVANAIEFDQVFTLRDAAENKVLFSPAGGLNYIYDGSVGRWVSTSPLPVGTLYSNSAITVAYIKGTTYIYFQQYGCFSYDTVTKLLVPVVLGGLVAANIIGICGASGYMIVWDATNTIYWSSAVDPIDFVPSLLTGAGSAQVSDAAGRIVTCLRQGTDFMVYTTNNAIIARYSGNLQFPFTLKEIASSGGVVSAGDVNFTDNTLDHFAWTDGGLQQLSKGLSTSVYPEATDFLSANIFEDFDAATLLFTRTRLTAPLNVRISSISDRYYIMSYGVSFPFTHALIYDKSIDRWGKVKLDHVACFEYTYPNFYGTRTYGQLLGITYGELLGTPYGQLSIQQGIAEPPRKNIGFLQRDGTVKLMNFDVGNPSADGILILGKFQFTRTRNIQLQAFEVENCYANFLCYAVPTYDGKTLGTPILGTALNQGEDVWRLGFGSPAARNWTFLHKGGFNIVTGVIYYNVHGRTQGAS